MAALLFIVARDNHRLAGYLKQKLAAEKGIQVTLDRRRGERRQPSPAHMPERRRSDRRRLRVNENDLRSYGFVIIDRQ